MLMGESLLHMQGSQREYQEKYTELNLLGRGNYGSAYVVQNNFTNKCLVAKKMNIDGMPESEVEAAKGEIQILEKFSDTKMYPFIVKYIQCFLFEKTLIIIMEFCEFGDLATFLKAAKKKGELLEEDVILAWFIMLAMGIESLHSKNILHRDLKSANVFLTSNKFIKIGDFGISKVLDSTSAKTFVGTPYYLSPEVCSNKKYDLRSDLWSLGCILYELCTLNYPFEANNILSLAMKITSQQIKPISNKYSKELQNIVSGLLTKDQNKRHNLNQILKSPFIEKYLQKNGGRIQQICSTIPLRRTVVSKIQGEQKAETIRRAQSDTTAEDTMKTIRSNFQATNKSDTLNYTKSFEGSGSLEMSNTSGMSPLALKNLRKQQKIKREQEQLKRAVRENVDTRMFAKSKKAEELGGSGSNFAHNTNARTLNLKYQESNKQAAEDRRRVKHGLGDNQSINLESLNELTTKMRDLGVTENYSNIQIPEHIQEREIKGNETYKMYTEAVEEQVTSEDDELEEYYDDDFEDYVPEEISKIEEAKQEKEAVGVFMSVISGKSDGVSPTKRAAVQKAFEKKTFGQRTNKQREQQCVEECLQILGGNKQRYINLYNLVSQCYVGGQYTESKEVQELKLLRKEGPRSVKLALSLIDQIKFYEQE